ncbi:MAG: hypothetical protein KAJ55_07430, partial [Anaerolineales bacterium]|nr:hypothetical protein [Anaerolineales bacterium]
RGTPGQWQQEPILWSKGRNIEIVYLLLSLSLLQGLFFMAISLLVISLTISLPHFWLIVFNNGQIVLGQGKRAVIA